MGVCTRYCDPCIYRKKFQSGALPYCDHLCMTGKPRPCPAGDGCTVRVTRRVYRKRELTEEEKAARAQRKKEWRREYDRRRRKENREKILEQQKKYKQEHREQVNAYSREYRKRRKECEMVNVCGTGGDHADPCAG